MIDISLYIGILLSMYLKVQTDRKKYKQNEYIPNSHVAQWGGIRTWENSGFHLRGCQMIVLYPNRTARWVLLHFESYKIFF